MSEQDKNYLIDSVVAHTGISRPEAAARVNDAFERNRQSVDATRASYESPESIGRCV